MKQKQYICLFLVLFCHFLCFPTPKTNLFLIPFLLGWESLNYITVYYVAYYVAAPGAATTVNSKASYNHSSVTGDNYLWKQDWWLCWYDVSSHCCIFPPKLRQVCGMQYMFMRTPDLRTHSAACPPQLRLNWQTRLDTPRRSYPPSQWYSQEAP